MRLWSYVPVLGVCLHMWPLVASSLRETRFLRHMNEALASPRFAQTLEDPEEDELQGEIDDVDEGVAALKERQKAAIQASAASARHRAQELSESFQGARRRRKEQQSKKAAAAAARISAAKKKTAAQPPATERPRPQTKPIECRPESEAKITEVPPEEVLEAGATPEAAPKGEIEILERALERLAPAENAGAAAVPTVIHPPPVQAATQEEIQKDVLAAEAEAREVESQKQEETNKEIVEEMQHLVEEHRHASAVAAATAAAQEAEEEEAAASASEAEREAREVAATVEPEQSSAASRGEGQAAPAAAAAAAVPAEPASTGAPEHGSSKKPAAAEPEGSEAATAEAEDEDETEEESGDTEAEDEGDSNLNTNEKKINHHSNSHKNTNKTDAAKSSERENAERTVGGTANQGRKPPI